MRWQRATFFLLFFPPCTCQILHFKEPLILYGEGDYALTDIKEVKVTKSFLRLNEIIQQCQDEETLEDCQAKEYLKIGKEKCSCTPFEFRDFSKEVKMKK